MVAHVAPRVSQSDPSEVLRRLDLVVRRKLDGLLNGDYQGLVPGHGSEQGETRLYAPGDDVRRIDWNVTARMTEPHVRETIADRELECWILADDSPTLDFGTALCEKRDLAVAASAAIGFLTHRTGNRIGAVLAGPDGNQIVPARGGKDHLLAVLHRLITAHRHPTGRTDLARALGLLGGVARRRGLIAVVSDFLEPPETWQPPLARLAVRHEVLCIEVVDPREVELPSVGVLSLVDPRGRARPYAIVAAPETVTLGSPEDRLVVTLSAIAASEAAPEFVTVRVRLHDEEFTPIRGHAETVTVPMGGTASVELDTTDVNDSTCYLALTGPETDEPEVIATVQNQAGYARYADTLPKPSFEWTAMNVHQPSYLDSEEKIAEMARQAKEMNFDAVLFAAKPPSALLYYDTRIGEKAPEVGDIDPLALAVKYCHEQGLQLLVQFTQLRLQRLDPVADAVQFALLVIAETAPRGTPGCRGGGGRGRRGGFGRLILIPGIPGGWRTLRQPVVVAAGVLDNPSPTLHHQRAGDDLVQEDAVVADEQQGAVEGGELLLEQLERLDIEVVGRLVEGQQVAGIEEEAGEEQAVALAPREHLDGCTGAGGLEEEVLQVGEDMARPAVHHDGLAPFGEVLRHALFGIQFRAQLVDAADLQPAAVGDAAGRGLQPARQQAQQRGLARAVASREAGTLPPLDVQIHVIQNRVAAHAERDILKRDESHAGIRGGANQRS